MRSLASAVGQTLGKSGDLGDNTVDGQRIRIKIVHDLPVEQDTNDAHGKVIDRSREPGQSDQTCFPENMNRFREPKCIFLCKKVGEHDEHCNILTDRSGKDFAYWAQKHLNPVGILQRGSFRTIWQNFQSLQNQLKNLLHILFPE